jgi:hypothetical protein
MASRDVVQIEAYAKPCGIDTTSVGASCSSRKVHHEVLPARVPFSTSGEFQGSQILDAVYPTALLLRRTRLPSCVDLSRIQSTRCSASQPTPFLHSLISQSSHNGKRVRQPQYEPPLPRPLPPALPGPATRSPRSSPIDQPLRPLRLPEQCTVHVPLRVPGDRPQYRPALLDPPVHDDGLRTLFVPPAQFHRNLHCPHNT